MADEERAEDAPDAPAAKQKPYVIAPPRKRPAGAIALVGAGAVAVALLAWPMLALESAPEPMEASDVEPWQDDTGGASTGRIDAEPVETERVVYQDGFDAGPLEDRLESERQDLERRNAELAEEMAALREELATLAARPADDGTAVAEALQAVQAQNAELIEQMQAEFDNRLRSAELAEEQRLARERAARETAAAAEEAEARARDARLDGLMQTVTAVRDENRMLRERLDGGMTDMLSAREEADRIAHEEAERRAQLEARRAEAEALARAQVRSDGVVFDAGGTGGAASAGTDGASGPASADAAGRAFVGGAEAAPVSRAEIIAHPERTVLQGTVIEATLETAIDTGLPGPVTAVVTRPVASFDGSRHVIPAGARLFGRYSSDVSLGQSRALVGWSRIVTPDGQSVQLAAFGADPQGRSGLTGRVNTRFAQRFGSAALLSVIAAAPAAAAGRVEDKVGREIAEGMSADLERGTRGVVGTYATLPPVIAVQPGAAITVIVDRDLELL